MAGSSVTFTEIVHRSVKKIKAAWVSDDAAGTASGTTTNVYSGKIVGLTTVPGGGATQPADNYSVTATDADSVDVLMGGGATRDDTNAEHVLSASLGMVVESKLTVNISAAGNSKTGTVYIFIQ